MRGIILKAHALGGGKMKLNLEQIEKITLGAVRAEQDYDCFRLHPNDEGAKQYFGSLSSQIAKYI